MLNKPSYGWFVLVWLVFLCLCHPYIPLKIHGIFLFTCVINVWTLFGTRYEISTYSPMHFIYNMNVTIKRRLTAWRTCWKNSSVTLSYHRCDEFSSYRYTAVCLLSWQSWKITDSHNRMSPPMSLPNWWHRPMLAMTIYIALARLI